MAKKPRNKAYRRRAVNPCAAFAAMNSNHFAQAMSQPLNDEQMTDVGIAYHLALEEFVAGRGGENHFNTIVCSLNIAVVLCERGIGDGHEALIVNALEGIFRAKIRYGRTKKWGLDGPALIAIRAAFDLHAEQIRLATREEMRLALVEVHRRIDAGNVYREMSETTKEVA